MQRFYFIWFFKHNILLQWNICSFSLMSLAWNKQVELKEKNKRKTFCYILLKYFEEYCLRCLYSHLGPKQKQCNQNTAMPTMESSLRSESSLTLWWQPRLCPVAITHPCQVCAFYCPDPFMTGRGVSYYVYVSTAHSLPGIKTRGCHYRDYSAADQRCWWEPKHTLGKATENTL